MGKNSNAPAKAGATSKEVVETPVVETPVVENTEVVEAEIVNEAEVIPSNIFVAEDGTQVEFAVKHFIHARKKYTVEEAVAEIPEILQELYDRKSFIFKKV
jgi:hypothetical protein